MGGQSANGYAEVLANNVTLSAILLLMQMLKVSVTIRTEVRLLKKQKVLFLTPGRRHNN